MSDGDALSEWKDLSSNKLDMDASGTVIYSDYGNQHVSFNEATDILKSRSNSPFSGKEFSIEMFAVVELSQEFNQQFGTILGQFGDNSNNSSPTKSLALGVGYPNSEGQTKMFTDSWSPVGSQTEMNLDKDKILLLNSSNFLIALNSFVGQSFITTISPEITLFKSEGCIFSKSNK